MPDHFDKAHRCLVVAPSSGSRGVYGAISLAGAWGLPKGCAVAYTDKGTGPGYFDYADDSGVQLDRITSYNVCYTKLLRLRCTWHGVAKQEQRAFRAAIAARVTFLCLAREK